MDDCDEQGAVCISELHATYQGLVVIKCGGWHVHNCYKNILLVNIWKHISVMVCKKSAYPNCSGRVITAPEDL